MKQLLNVFAVGISLLIGSCGQKSDPIAYVDSLKLFDGFKMKSEYDKILESDLRVEALKLDSVKTILENSSDTMEIYKLRKEYVISERLYTDKFEALSSNYTKLVTERLDEYVKKYALQNDIKMVLTNSSGAVVYVEEKSDITKAVLDYANGEFDK